MKKLLGKVAALFAAEEKATPNSRTVADSLQPEEPARAPFVAFQPHNSIEQLLMEAAAKPDARAEFQRALLDAELYAATPESPPSVGIRTVEAGERLSLLNVQSPDGARVAAIFTAQERIFEVFGLGAGFIGMRGETLLEVVAAQGAWLNPGFPYSVYWKPGDLAALLGKPLPRVLQKDTQVMLGAPADAPTALIEALRARLGGDARIAEAWLALAHWPEEGKSSWYLDVRTDLDGPVVQELLAETFKRADYAGRPLDMILNKPGGREGIGIRIAPAHVH